MQTQLRGMKSLICEDQICSGIELRLLFGIKLWKLFWGMLASSPHSDVSTLPCLESEENAVTHWTPLQLAETGKLLNKLVRNCPAYCIIQTLQPRLQSPLVTPVTCTFWIYFSISSSMEHFLAVMYAQHCEKCF